MGEILGGAHYSLVYLQISGEQTIRLGATSIAGEPHLPSAYADYADVFNKEKASILPEHAEHDHIIEL